MSHSRRDFIKNTGLTTAGILVGGMGFSAKSYGNIIGANDRVRVGVVGFSDRHRSSHIPSFMNHYKELNFVLLTLPCFGAACKKKHLTGLPMKCLRRNDDAMKT